jgi:ectoine hydroxylase-related dioxygenase (phytanoyl-CoA dioxygenase family)
LNVEHGPASCGSIEALELMSVIRKLEAVMLSESQTEQFWRDGFLVAENAVSNVQLDTLRRQLVDWIDESRRHSEPFGPPTVDERPRFDMGADHTSDKPALRRVNNPSEINQDYFEVMSDSAMVDMVADLIGPNVKLHHCKINLKLPGALTTVAYHQDFAYTPHTNNDIITALLLLDDMTESNGCLTAVPGSHKGPVYSLFKGETFRGKVQARVAAEAEQKQSLITGTAGSVCLMHTRTLHGSEANRSDQPRGIYLCIYTSADAFPIAPNPMPSPQEGLIVRGEKSRVARLIDAEIELPDQPKSTSFFTVIGQASTEV